MQRNAFTLIELLIVIALISILFSSAIPGLYSLVQNQRQSSALNRFVTGLHLARSEAVKRNEPVVLCRGNPTAGCNSHTGWEQGWFIFVDSDGDRRCADLNNDHLCDADGSSILKTETSMAGMTVLANGNPGDHGYILFTGSGFAEGFASTFRFCDQDGAVEYRRLVLSMVGRPQVRDVYQGSSCE